MAVTALAEVTQHILACMCGALADTAAEIEDHPTCPCRMGQVPGSTPVICCPTNTCDGGDQGQLSVHVAHLYRSTVGGFPQQTIALMDCKTALQVVAAEIVVTLVRCIPIVNDRGVLPSMEAQSRAAEIQFIDMMTLETALACCVPDMAGRRKPLRVAQLDHRSIGPTGPNGPTALDAKCAGSELHIAVDLGMACCPEPVS